MSGPDRREIQLAWLRECGADLRARTQAADSLESENLPYIFPEKIKQCANGSDHAFSLRVLLKEVLEPDKSPGYVFSLRVLFLSAPRLGHILLDFYLLKLMRRRSLSSKTSNTAGSDATPRSRP